MAIGKALIITWRQKANEAFSSASETTWINNVAELAKEFNMHPLKVHEALFEQLPEIFGR